MVSINSVSRVQTDLHDPSALIVTANITDDFGETYDCNYCTRPEQEETSGSMNAMFQQWLAANQGQYDVLPFEPVAPTEDIYSAAIQKLLDTTAAERRYDNINSAISYRDDSNPKYANEAAALFAWRSIVWTYADAELAKVMAGDRSIPTVSEFLAELPPFAWP